MSFVEAFMLYVCPTIGSILCTVMFAAPVNDLRRALAIGDFGVLDPFPFVMMAGNCLGWIVYGHLLMDPFLVAANIAGFICSVWLNFGSAKLQYHRLQQARGEQTAAAAQLAQEEQWDASPAMDMDDGEHGMDTVSFADGAKDAEVFALVPQEVHFFRMMCAWAALATYCTWFTDAQTGANIVAWAVNINLVFFYGAPLNIIKSVVESGDSAAIHRPTLKMSYINTSFWILYGIARGNPFVVAPNATGLLLGIIQGILCLYYPAKRTSGDVSSGTPSSLANMAPQPLSQEVDDFV